MIESVSHTGTVTESDGMFASIEGGDNGAE